MVTLKRQESSFQHLVAEIRSKEPVGVVVLGPEITLKSTLATQLAGEEACDAGLMFAYGRGLWSKRRKSCAQTFKQTERFNVVVICDSVSSCDYRQLKRLANWLRRAGAVRVVAVAAVHEGKGLKSDEQTYNDLIWSGIPTKKAGFDRVYAFSDGKE